MAIEHPTIGQIHSIVGRHFSGRATRFDSEPTHDLKSPAQHDAWFGRVAEWIGPLVDGVGRRVLDPGCATGFFSLIAAELGHDPVGVDISEGMVAEASRKAAAASLKASFQVGDAASTGLVPGTFDVVLERHLLWTLPSPASAVRHWLELLRPGGRLVSVGVDWRSETGSATAGDYAPVRPMLPFYGGRPAADIVTLLTGAGFVDISVESLHDDVYWLDGRNRDRFAVTGYRGRE